MLKDLDPCFQKKIAAIATMKGNLYATKRYHSLLMTRLACNQLLLSVSHLCPWVLPLITCLLLTEPTFF